jgi:hypothetical protein
MIGIPLALACLAAIGYGINASMGTRPRLGFYSIWIGGGVLAALLAFFFLVLTQT